MRSVAPRSVLNAPLKKPHERGWIFPAAASIKWQCAAWDSRRARTTAIIGTDGRAGPPKVRYNASMLESVPTGFSRRDLSLLLPLLAATKAGAQNVTLPSKTYSFDQIPVQTSGENQTRPVLDGEKSPEQGVVP